tara:strand:+ start:253 stop:747 length:495 start_codon:yes stop_codon:yes gene_type:complete
MEQIIFEDLGMGLDLTRITFIRKRTPQEREEFLLNQYRTMRRREINEAVMDFHREREIRERIFMYRLREIVELNTLRESMYWDSIPEDFWEPVKVTANTDNLIFTDEQWECFICREQQTKKTILLCCSQEICDICVENWFNKESVRCPFCKRDIREQENQYSNE